MPIFEYSRGVFFNNNREDLHVFSNFVSSVRSPTDPRILEPDCGNLKCDQAGSFACSSCHLVKYCSKECQKAHWKSHKHACKNHPLASLNWQPQWVNDRRVPKLLGGETSTNAGDRNTKKCLWGNTPAIDIVNLYQNEGSTYDKELRICFTGSGDLRNVIQTVVNLPETFTQDCVIVVNDNDPDVVIRNALIMLIVYNFPAVDAATIIAHVWYSARLPQKFVDAISNLIKPTVSLSYSTIPDGPKDDDLIGVKWYLEGEQNVFIVLAKKDWRRFSKILDFNIDQERAEATRRSAYNTRINADQRDLGWLGCTTHRRIAQNRFIEEGILVSFGADTSTFEIFNPTLVDDSGKWIETSCLYPLQGWDIHSVLASGQEAGFAKNDLYGALSCYLHDNLIKFHKSLHRRPTTIQLICEDALKLPAEVMVGSFDRIDLTSLIDDQWIGLTGLLDTFEPLLKSKADNKHATITGMYMALVSRIISVNPHLVLENEKKMIVRTCETLGYNPIGIAVTPPWHPQACLYYTVRQFFPNFDRYLDPTLEHSGLLIKQHLGLDTRADNTVVEKWPFRVKGTGSITMEEVEKKFLGGLTGEERIVEWKRI